jgi:hypothetical protein
MAYPQKGMGKSGALSMMEAVSPYVKIYRAPASRQPAATPSMDRGADPKLILVAAWMDAVDAHIAKYVNKYMEMYPSSDIIVLKRPFLHTVKTQEPSRAMKPVPPLIRELLPNPSTTKPELLIHLLSNGGTSSLRDTATQWARSASPGSPAQLPLHVTIFDSSPGTMTAMGNIRVVYTFIKTPWVRIILLPLLWIINAITFLWFGLIDPPDPPARSNIAMNDRDKMHEVRRTYMYSKQDQLVEWRDVERHAAEARRKGFEVRMERWEKGAHVSLVRVDEERYWRIVRETWAGPLNQTVR